MAKRAREEAWAVAVDTIDELRAIYNRPVSNKPALDARGLDRTAEAVATKTANFCALFASSACVRDLLTLNPVLRDMSALRQRYQLTFRESGPTLRMEVHMRAVFTPADVPRAPAEVEALVLDLEMHSHLVTMGAAGPRPPREQPLYALYALAGGRVANVWLSPAPAPTGVSGSAALPALQARDSGALWSAIMRQAESALGCRARVATGACQSASVGSFAMQGVRLTMEDEMSVERIPAPLLAGPTASRALYLGLFDGHGGAACAKFAASHLHAELGDTRELIADGVGGAISRAFAATEGALRKSEERSGSTALVALLGGGMLHVAHVGDSRAVLASGPRASATRLTADHKPELPEERARVEAAGGRVVWGGACWRVTHARTETMLACSRSLGDFAFKQSAIDAAEIALAAAELEAADAADAADATDSPTAPATALAPGSNDAPKAALPRGEVLSAEPKLGEREIAADDRFIILACDVVWDVLSDQHACDSGRDAHKADSADAKAAARQLAGDAYRAGSQDNISVLVVVLRHVLD